MIEPFYTIINNNESTKAPKIAKVSFGYNTQYSIINFIRENFKIEKIEDINNFLQMVMPVIEIEVIINLNNPTPYLFNHTRCSLKINNKYLHISHDENFSLLSYYDFNLEDFYKVINNTHNIIINCFNR